MRKGTLFGVLAAAAVMATVAGMEFGGSVWAAAPSGAATMHANMWAGVKRAVAVLVPTKGNEAVSGTIWFDETDKGVRIHGEVTGFAPNSTHAMHIHEFGDASTPDGMGAGGHFNPEGHQHGAPTAEMHHAGDLGNIKADATGKATVDITVDDISIAGMKDPVIGRGVVIHLKEDDFSQPVGNAGGRMAVGVIGIAKTPPATP